MLDKHKYILKRLLDLIYKEEDCAIRIYNDPAEVRVQTQILREISRVVSEEFMVLVLGYGKVGISSMINALIGEELLPTECIPKTIIPCELHYGDKKRAVLYPKKDICDGRNTPFELKKITNEEIEKYVSFDDEKFGETVDKVSSKFEKIVIYWPLEFLRNGLVLIDTPSFFNDAYMNAYIENNYILNADAIIFLRSSLFYATREDMEYLQRINDIAGKNIIIGHTYYDVVVKHAVNLHALHAAFTKEMEQYSDLGLDGMHFLSSLEGLDAKINNDKEAFRNSGYEELERYLEQYLVKVKGNLQIKRMATAIMEQADAMIQDAEDINSDADDLEYETYERTMTITRLRELQSNAIRIAQSCNVIIETLWVEEVYVTNEHGTCVTGIIRTPGLKVNDAVKVYDYDGNFKGECMIRGIEKGGKLFLEAEMNDIVGLLLDTLYFEEDIVRGDTLFINRRK